MSYYLIIILVEYEFKSGEKFARSACRNGGMLQNLACHGGVADGTLPGTSGMLPLACWREELIAPRTTAPDRA